MKATIETEKQITVNGKKITLIKRKDSYSTSYEYKGVFTATIRGMKEVLEKR